MVASGRPWFRFAGLAGTRISSKCVPHNRCGTSAPLWTDKPMPTQIGVVFPLTVYGSLVGDCKKYTVKASVLRCSAKSNILCIDMTIMRGVILVIVACMLDYNVFSML